jgi:1-acyl-sn-glycerol-3-phosphate acyltransferase
LAQGGNWRILFDLALLGVFGGFFIVPLYALVQQRSSDAHRARTIAANNIFNALFMVVGALVAAAMLASGLSIPSLFAVAALCNAAVAIFIYGLVPEFLLRFIVWLLAHTIYRLRVDGMTQIPHEGPALIFCNHVSSVDALIIMAGCRRPIRFVVGADVAKQPVIGFVLRAGRAIVDTSPSAAPHLTDDTIAAIATALANGDLVAIFPEGRVTETGEMNACGEDLSRIIQRVSVPVVPMALRGLWGSLFSRMRNTSLLGKMFCHIELAVGAPLAVADMTPERLRETLVALRGATR